MNQKQIKTATAPTMTTSTTPKHPGVDVFAILFFILAVGLGASLFGSASSHHAGQYTGLVLLAFAAFGGIMALIVYFSKTTKTMTLGLLGISITGLGVHLLTHRQLEGSAMLYIGIPLLLVYVFKNTGQAKTATGGILKGITIVLLLSGPILQEGFICIIMAAPLFYIVGGATGLIIDSIRRKELSKFQASPIFILLGLMSLEGISPELSFNRDHIVKVEQIVEATPAAIQAQLNQPLVLGNAVPLYLKLFPFPTVKQHGGTEVGDRTTLNFVYYKHVYFSPKIGDLVYEVTKRDENSIESRIISDDSYVNTYMDWKTSKVSWQPFSATKTKISWEISYTRKLDPAWYFGPLEYFTTALMADALIKYAAIPADIRAE